MLEIRLFVASGVNLAVFAPSHDGVINREKVYFCLIQMLTRKL